MSAIRQLFNWLSRKAVLYVLLLIAISISTVLVPWAKQFIAGRTPAQMRAQVLSHATQAIAAERSLAVSTFNRQAQASRTSSVAELDARLARLRSERTTLRNEIAGARPRWMLAITDPDAVLPLERKRLRLGWVNQELPAVEAARAAVASNGATLTALTDLRAQQARVSQAIPRCNAAAREVRSFEDRWRWRLRKWWDSDEHKALIVLREQRCATARQTMRQRDHLLTVARSRIEARRKANAAFERAAVATSTIERVGRDLGADAAKAQIEWRGSLPQKLRLWSQRLGLPSLLRQAAIALAIVIAVPFLIRIFCYFVLAPAAMRRPAIRLRILRDVSVPIPLAARSTTSVSVRLASGEELLVRQDYLQTTSHAGRKETQWFLDWRHLFTSLASGLAFLTRIRGDGELTTVSAVRDPLAEVTILTLPEGASCVVQPRALAAVAQPIHRRLRVTTQWRLGSLNAWLTMQLRYVIFHGPARLVIKGGRGVRVEHAEQGRIFGQDQLVGFSADLAYSVTRTETFWPYFFGREQLLKDRVEAGSGVLIIEEAPLSVQRGEVRRGIEGLVDASMKAFGI